MITKTLVRWWLTPKLPEIHKKTKFTSNSFIGRTRDFLVHWFGHPVKRRMARLYVLLLQRFFGLKVIGITGSVGKTTTKEMIYSILKVKAKTVISYANIDPVFNIPTTILRCTPLTRFLVLEMGVEYPGEMDFYLWLVKPDISVITGIYKTHTEFFKSVEGVYEEKIKLLNNTDKKGFVVLNSENDLLFNLKGCLKTRLIYYGKASQIKAANIQIINLSNTNYTLVIKTDKISVQLPTLGYPFVLNSLAAAGVTFNLDYSLRDIKRGLESFKPLQHRFRPIIINKSLIIDDTYNSNPQAVISSLKTIKEISSGRKIVVVFGDMLELGSYSKEAHIKIGEILGSMDISFLIGVGRFSKLVVDKASEKIGKERCRWVDDEIKVDKLIYPFLNQKSLIFLKGSRGISLDKVISRLS